MLKSFIKKYDGKALWFCALRGVGVQTDTADVVISTSCPGEPVNGMHYDHLNQAWLCEQVLHAGVPGIEHARIWLGQYDLTVSCP
jgi:hypothetical protein